MSKLIFLSNPSSIYEGTLSKVNDNVIRLIFLEKIPDEKELLSGLNIINEHNGKVMSSRIGYETIYRIYEDNPLMIELSNNGSTWVKPLPKVNFYTNGGGILEGETVQEVYVYEDLIIPIPTANENYQFVKWNTEIPTNGEIDSNKSFTAIFEYVPTIEEIKISKINNFSNIANSSITNGVDVQIGENIEHFSYTDEDQVNIKEIFDLALQTNVPMYYHANGKECKLYTVEEIISIYSSASTNKMHHQTYFNQIRAYINSLNTIDEVNNVEYGQKLTDKYLQTYNEAMGQAQFVLEALLTKRTAMLAEE